MVKVGVVMHWCVISSIPFLQHSPSFDINSILQHSFPIAFSSDEQQNSKFAVALSLGQQNPPIFTQSLEQHKLKLSLAQ